ncbi:MAG TPA: methyl-accepting chemotaxis protein [Chloroflexota bacterium]|nr:methyl-accepting chemotaxis protein [Chloroflexota bacterium]
MASKTRGRDGEKLGFLQSFKGKFFIIVLLLAILPALVVGLVAGRQSGSALETEASEKLQETAQLNAQRTQDWANTRLKEVQVLAETDSVRSMDPAIARPFLKTAQKQFGGTFATFSLVNGSGTIIANTEDQEGASVTDRDYYKPAMSGNPVISDALVSKATGDIVVIAVSPVKTKDGKTGGIILGTVSLKGFYEQNLAKGSMKDSYTFVLSKDGTTIAHPVADNIMKDNPTKATDPAMAAMAKAMVQGQTGTANYSYNGAGKVAGYGPVGVNGWSVATVQGRDAALGAVDEINRISWSILALVAVIVIPLAIWIARSFSSPITFLAAAAIEYAEGGLGQDLDAGTVERMLRRRDELGLLAKSFKRMANGFKGMADVARRIADGDLTAQVELRSDHDVLGIAFQEMSSHLREMVAETQSSARELAATSTQLGEAANQTGDAVQQVNVTIQSVAQGAQQQATVAQETTSAMSDLTQAISQVASGSNDQARGIQSANDTAGQMAVGVEQVAANANQVAHESEKTRDAAVRGNQMVQETIAGISRLKETVDRTATQIDELGRASEQIGAVVETIDDIAEQTNLLALNAAIEAARAGEHGRGFAVVADEVRKLAERSSKETRQIAELVRSVQAGTKAAVDAMHSGASEAEAGSDLAARAGEALEQIVRSVEETVQQVSQIAAASQQMAASSKGVTAALETISAVTEQSLAATEQMELLARTVSQAIESSAATAEENSAATEEVSASSEEMSAQVEEMSAQAAQLSRTAEELRKMVARFKLDESDGGQAGLARPSEVVVQKRRTDDWRSIPERQGGNAGTLSRP